MNDTASIPEIVGYWFTLYREKYRWPKGSSRKESEQRVDKFQKAARSVLDNEDTNALKDALIDIHQWKTNNRGGTTEEYRKSLDERGSGYLKQLLSSSTFKDTNNLDEVLRKLKIDESNLPVCTAIASFMYDRKDVPIIDRFLAQFFAREFKVSATDSETKEVLSWVRVIDFKLDNGGKKLRDGKRALRLAVYSKRGFSENLNLYTNKLVPECERIAKALNVGEHRYSDIYGESRKFAPIDVEMAIFAWANKHAKLFDVSEAC